MTKLMSQSDYKVIDAIHRYMQHCTGMPNHGVTLQPQGNRGCTKDFNFVISRRFNSDYIKDPVMRHSISDTKVPVNGAVV